MYMNTLRSYAEIMLLMSISLTIVGLTNVFPYSVEIVGVNTSDLMTGVSSDITTIQGLINTGNPLEYTIAVGYLLWAGIKIIISVFLFVFGGFGSVLKLFGIHSDICSLLQIIVDFVIAFELAQTFLIKSS